MLGLIFLASTSLLTIPLTKPSVIAPQSEPSLADPKRTTSAVSLIPNGDFKLGNTGFLSDRTYLPPSRNCLWGSNYTIASRFDSPAQLHTNIASEPFSDPDGGNMLYMNSGRSEIFFPWSAEVKCKPRTTYRVSFSEIGLTRGAEWRNLYEIRVNGERSTPELGGDGQFVTISFEWRSRSTRRATVSIVRLPNAHGGGIIGIGNIKMVPIPSK